MLWAVLYYDVDTNDIFFNFKQNTMLFKEILFTLFDDIKR